MCLDAASGQGRDGDELIIYPCHEGPNQRWRILPSGEIRGMNNKCVDVEGGSADHGAKVQLWTCNSDGNQRWNYDSVLPRVRGDYCFGAVGQQCSNLPQLQFGFCEWGGINMSYCSVAVGSQLHDSCCAKNSRGYMCGGDGSQPQACRAEWDHAVSDTVNGRVWKVYFSGKNAFPISYPLVNGNGPGMDALRAPAGTALAVADAAAGWCESGRYSTYYIGSVEWAKCE
jgi:hypothetical protein